MNDRVIILAMLTGTWLFGAWGTFAFVKLRRMARAKKNEPVDTRLALYVAARFGVSTPRAAQVYYPVGRTRASRVETLDRADTEVRKGQLRDFAPRQSHG